jgi:hypothetical protein
MNIPANAGTKKGQKPTAKGGGTKKTTHKNNR